MFLQVQEDFVRVHGTVAFEHLARTVGRKIVADTKFDGKIGFLRQYALDSLADEIALVVDEHGNADERSVGVHETTL